MFGPEYPKIQTIYKRDPATRHIIIGEYTTPELKYLADSYWIWTEKIDGMNIRLHFDGEKVTIGGRTDNAQIPTSLIEALSKYTSDISKWDAAFYDPLGQALDVTLYGEGYGAGIQKGGCYIPNGKDFILFDVRVGDWWLQPADVKDVAANLGIRGVPCVGISKIADAAKWVAGTHGYGPLTSVWEGVKPEGLVGRPVVDLYDRKGRRIITKLKVKDFEDLARG